MEGRRRAWKLRFWRKRRESRRRCSNAARRSAGAVDRVLGVHGVPCRDIHQLDWCGSSRPYPVLWGEGGEGPDIRACERLVLITCMARAV
jgi:hypothetical protein